MDILSISDTHIKNSEALKVDSGSLLKDFLDAVDK